MHGVIEEQLKLLCRVGKHGWPDFPTAGQGWGVKFQVHCVVDSVALCPAHDFLPRSDERWNWGSHETEEHMVAAAETARTCLAQSEVKMFL